MFTEQQLASLAQLDSVLQTKPSEQLEAEVRAISRMDFGGTSAQAYFDDFHLNFQGAGHSERPQSLLRRRMKQFFVASRDKKHLPQVRIKDKYDSKASSVIEVKQFLEEDQAIKHQVKVESKNFQAEKPSAVIYIKRVLPRKKEGTKRPHISVKVGDSQAREIVLRPK